MPIRGEAEQKTYRDFRGVSRGIVLAHHKILGETCIQKTYAPAGRDDAIAFAEPRLLNELDHPHITPMREAQYDPDRTGYVTIVMKVYEGGSIHDAITKAGHRFSTGAAMTITQHVAEALAYLHSEKMYVHRDVKPKNVLLDTDRTQGFLSDFGSAARLDPVTNTAGLVRTTPLYQAPEGAQTGHTGAPADVYALGLTAFETLNGLFAYETLDATTVDGRINRGHRALPERMLAPSAYLPHVPSALRRVLRQAYDADPDKRPTAAELVRRLRDLRCVDWLRMEGEGLDGQWTGWWPPGKRPENQIELRLTSKVLAGGAKRGRRRLTADYKRVSSGGWRTVGGPETVDIHDAAALSAFFSAVDAQAARRWPA